MCCPSHVTFFTGIKHYVAVGGAKSKDSFILIKTTPALDVFSKSLVRWLTGCVSGKVAGVVTGRGHRPGGCVLLPWGSGVQLPTRGGLWCGVCFRPKALEFSF